MTTKTANKLKQWKLQAARFSLDDVRRVQESARRAIQCDVTGCSIQADNVMLEMLIWESVRGISLRSGRYEINA